MEVSGQPHSLVSLPLVKEPQVLTEQEPGWTPEPVGRSLLSLPRMGLRIAETLS
jgi:hypothetical protein